jgi:hypothetical protein
MQRLLVVRPHRSGLDKNHRDSALCRALLQFFNQCRRNAFSPTRHCNGQIVNTDFAALLFELLQLVGREASRQTGQTVGS